MAVLLVIIAIALASIVWLFASTQTQALARSARVDIIDAGYISSTVSGTGSTASVTLKNTGTIAIRITNIAIYYGSTQLCTPSIQYSNLNPGETATYVAIGTCPSCSGSTQVCPGMKLTIVVEGFAVGTNEPVKAVGQVVVM
jgi:hypothetical protein